MTEDGSRAAAAAAPTAPCKALPWVERYRPKRVTDVASQEEVVRTLETAIEQRSLPHLLFFGPPGTGKTSTALALAQSLFGPNLYKSRILEMNASDERGIQVVRDKIKTFAQAAVSSSAAAGGFPCPNFKLIILDEADAMTRDAQAALRRTIEAHAKVTRFCLICNYVSRIIEPLASRCAKYRFKPLPAEAMRARLLHICGQEQLTCSSAVLENILIISGGDMRKAVTMLQSAFTLFGGAGTALSPEAVMEAAGLVPGSVMEGLWDAIRSNNFERLSGTVDDVLLEGFAAPIVLDQLHKDVVTLPSLSDARKGKICMAIGRADKCLVDGASEALQLLDCTAEIMRLVAGSGEEL